ncbi:MAG: hypothetical protein J0L75_21425 [Spirochaetes bacterium]|nr:hypothetical protein [Spirochaetota bacterium]
MHCHHCRAAWKGLGQPHFREACACGHPLHACLNCRHHDPSRRYECLEPIDDRIGDKAAFNLCESFQFADRSLSAKSEEEKKAEARRKFEGLF